MRLEEEVSLYLSCRRAEGLAEGTLAGEALALKRFGAWLSARGIASAAVVRREDVASWAEELARHRYRKSPKEEARALSAKSRHDLMAAVRDGGESLGRQRADHADAPSKPDETGAVVCRNTR